MQAGDGAAVGAKWTFEIKFDGYRWVAVKVGQEVTLFSRHKKVLNKRFPGVVDALASLDSDFVLDGELVALDSKGRPSFQILQNNLSRTLPVYFYCFDLLNRDGETLVSSPIEQRRDLLHRVVAAQRIRYASCRYYKRHPAKFLRRCVNWAWRVLSANGPVPSTNPASDRVPGSSFARTWSRSLSSVDTSLGREGSTRYLWAFTKRQEAIGGGSRNHLVSAISEMAKSILLADR